MATSPYIGGGVQFGAPPTVVGGAPVPPGMVPPAPPPMVAPGGMAPQAVPPVPGQMGVTPGAVPQPLAPPVGMQAQGMARPMGLQSLPGMSGGGQPSFQPPPGAPQPPSQGGQAPMGPGMGQQGVIQGGFQGGGVQLNALSSPLEAIQSLIQQRQGPSQDAIQRRMNGPTG